MATTTPSRRVESIPFFGRFRRSRQQMIEDSEKAHAAALQRLDNQKAREMQRLRQQHAKLQERTNKTGRTILEGQKMYQNAEQQQSDAEAAREAWNERIRQHMKDAESQGLGYTGPQQFEQAQALYNKLHKQELQRMSAQEAAIAQDKRRLERRTDRKIIANNGYVQRMQDQKKQALQIKESQRLGCIQAAQAQQDYIVRKQENPVRAQMQTAKNEIDRIEKSIGPVRTRLADLTAHLAEIENAKNKFELKKKECGPPPEAPDGRTNAGPLAIAEK